MITNRHPIDFDSLEKGDVIPPELLEDITGHKIGTAKFDLAVLSLREKIMGELLQRGRIVSVGMVKGSLKILTDEEAAEYESRLFKAGHRKQKRSFVRLQGVDQTKLSDEQKGKHERRVVVYGRMLQAQRDARKLTAQPHKRSTPGLPQPDSNGNDQVGSK